MRARSPWVFVGSVASLVALGLLPGSCFDSDERFVYQSQGTTGFAELPPGMPTPPELDVPPVMEPPPTATCRDAVDCVVGCAGELQQAMLPEPDLSCFLNCETGLNTDEALSLLRLAACASDRCVLLGECSDVLGGETGGQDPGTDTGSDPVDTDAPTPEELCLNCVVGGVLDLEPPGCLVEAAACK